MAIIHFEGQAVHADKVRRRRVDPLCARPNQGTMGGAGDQGIGEFILINIASHQVHRDCALLNGGEHQIFSQGRGVGRQHRNVDRCHGGGTLWVTRLKLEAVVADKIRFRCIEQGRQCTTQQTMRWAADQGVGKWVTLRIDSNKINGRIAVARRADRLR